MSRPRRDINQFGSLYPGFALWWDRWNGDSWCWRELPDSPFHAAEDDVTEGRGYRSKMAARAAIRAEIMRRQAHRSAAAVIRERR